MLLCGVGYAALKGLGEVRRAGKTIFRFFGHAGLYYLPNRLGHRWSEVSHLIVDYPTHHREDRVVAVGGAKWGFAC